MGIAAGVQAQEYWDKVKEREATFSLESGFETLRRSIYTEVGQGLQTVASLLQNQILNLILLPETAWRSEPATDSTI